MNKRGRPPFKITTGVKRKVKRLVSEGFSKKEIAAALGIGYSTLMEKQRDDPSLVRAMERGRKIRLDRLPEKKNELFEAAVSGDALAAMRFLVQRNPEHWSYDGRHEYRRAQKRLKLAERNPEALMADNPVLELETGRVKVSVFVVLLPGGPVVVGCSSLCQPGNLKGLPLV